MSILSAINPLAAIPLFLSLTGELDELGKSKIALRATLYVAIILFLFYVAGYYILKFYGISMNAFRIGGGLVIISSGFALLTGKFQKHKGLNKSKLKSIRFENNDFSLTPLAIPMLAGPGSISLVIEQAQNSINWIDHLTFCAVIFILTFIIYILLKYSFVFYRLLGSSGINAMSRILGFLLISLGIEMILKVFHVIGAGFC